MGEEQLKFLEFDDLCPDLDDEAELRRRAKMRHPSAGISAGVVTARSETGGAGRRRSSARRAWTRGGAATLDERTRKIGKQGVAAAKEALASGRPAGQTLHAVDTSSTSATTGPSSGGRAA